MGTAESKQGGAKVRVPPPLVFLGFLLAGVAVGHSVRPLEVPVANSVRLVLAAIVGLSGLALLITTNVLFRRSGQDPLPWKPSPSMILKGPYRYSRNPMYLGALLLQIGVGLALDSLWVVVFSAPALIVVHYTAVRPEEAYLSERFGEAYEKYKSSVRRYL